MMTNPEPFPALQTRSTVAIVQGDNRRRMIYESLIAIDDQIRPGLSRKKYVIIKPNICVAYHTYKYAATTNPWVVAELVKLCLGAGAGRVRAAATRISPPVSATSTAC